MGENDPNIVDRLKRLDTPAVSDALDRLEIAGRVTHLRQLITEQRGAIHSTDPSCRFCCR
jgi:hypothetical protein